MNRAAYLTLASLWLAQASFAQGEADPVMERMVDKVDPSVVAIQHGRATGSGFIISADGYLLSNGHVVTRNDAEDPTRAVENITVVLNDERKYAARVLGFSLDPDVALLKIEPESPLVPVEFADSLAARTGQRCFAVGTPVGLKRTYTSGILSNVDRADLDTFTRVFQTDAAINSGNSGGPLFDESGRAVGLNTYASRGANNLGFTIPIHVALEMKDHFLKQGRFIRSELSLCILGEIYDELAETLGVEGGILVHHVEPGTRVALAGLARGDVIVALDGTPCAARTPAQFLDFRWALTIRKPGTNIEATVLRGHAGKRERVTLTLPLTELNPIPPSGLQRGTLLTYVYPTLGLSYREIVLHTRLLSNLTGDAGVLVVGVEDNSVAARAGIAAGNIITRVGDAEVVDVASIEKALEAALAARTPLIPLEHRSPGHTYRTALAPPYELNGKHALLVTSAEGFEFLELLRRELVAAGVEVESRPFVEGDAGFVAATGTVDILVLCGASKPLPMDTAPPVLEVVRAVHERGGVVAAVGASSLALIRAEPALAKRRMTTSERVSSEALGLQASYTGKDVESDGRVVTTIGGTRDILRTFAKALREAAR